RYVKRSNSELARRIKGRIKRNRDGSGYGHKKIYGPYLKSIGWQYIEPKERLYLRADMLPPGRLIVMVNRHAVAVIDGVIHDTYDSGMGGKRPVEGYWSQAAAS